MIIPRIDLYPGSITPRGLEILDKLNDPEVLLKVYKAIENLKKIEKLKAQKAQTTKSR